MEPALQHPCAPDLHPLFTALQLLFGSCSLCGCFLGLALAQREGTDRAGLRKVDVRHGCHPGGMSSRALRERVPKPMNELCTSLPTTRNGEAHLGSATLPPDLETKSTGIGSECVSMLV